VAGAENVVDLSEISSAVAAFKERRRDCETVAMLWVALVIGIHVSVVSKEIVGVFPVGTATAQIASKSEDDREINRKNILQHVNMDLLLVFSYFRSAYFKDGVGAVRTTSGATTIRRT